MYRIRSAAGAEANYSSLEEFTAAVRRGLVAPEDEIFHTRANRWLDVKSHPHYRTALEGAPPAAPTPRPMAAPSPHHAPAPSQSRAQVFERPSAPVAKPVQHTEVHPRLQPQVAAPVVAAGPKAPAPQPAPYTPPAKSKELTFVDTGIAPTVGRPNAPAVDLAPPPAPAPVVQRTELRPAAKPAPVAKTTGDEFDFLIMDGGIESPVRTSAGHKTIPEEVNLLFEAQSVEPQAPVTAPKAKAPKSGKQHAVVIPEAAAPVAPAAPAPAPTPAPSAQVEPAPAPDAHVAPATDAPASSWTTGSRTNYLGGGIALVVIAVGLLAWKPWKSNGAPSAEPQQIAAQSSPSPASYDPTPNSLVTPASATTPPVGAMTGAGAVVAPPAKPAAKAADTPAAVDSGKKSDDIVVPARPDFGGTIPVTGDISIGSDVGTKSSTGAVAPSELVRRLHAAQKDAQLELNGRLVNLGFRGVINPARLSTPALVAAARSAWSGGVEAIRTYRSRIARLEKAYEDSVLTSQRAQRWSGSEMSAWATRQSLSEPSDASQLSDLMFTQVSEGLELLASTDYTIKGDKITFKEPASATRYTSIRGWVEQRRATWASTPESARPYSISATLRALGDGFPSVE